jgi:hypothetical protein
MKPTVWGTWPGKLVKQYGRFRLHASITALPPGVQTNTRRYRLLVENEESAPISLGSIEQSKSSLEGLIEHVKKWQRTQRVYITRLKDYIASDEDSQHDAGAQRQLEKLEARYTVVDDALHDLEARRQTAG